MTDLRTYLQAGTTRVEFGPTTDSLLDDLSKEVRRKTVKSIQGLFGASLKKLTGHLDNHSAMDMCTKLPGSFIYCHNYRHCHWTLQTTLRSLHSMSHQQSCSMNGLCTRAASGHRMPFKVTSQWQTWLHSGNPCMKDFLIFQQWHSMRSGCLCPASMWSDRFHSKNIFSQIGANRWCMQTLRSLCSCTTMVTLVADSHCRRVSRAERWWHNRIGVSPQYCNWVEFLYYNAETETMFITIYFP